MISALEQYAALKRTEFYVPFQVGHSGSVYLTVERDIYAPEVYHDDIWDMTIDGVPYVDSEDWFAFSLGRSGQHGYSGPVMHASEFLGGGMADDVLASPGIYVLVPVECWPEDEDDIDPEPAGWALLKWTGDK